MTEAPDRNFSRRRRAQFLRPPRGRRTVSDAGVLIEAGGAIVKRLSGSGPKALAAAALEWGGHLYESIGSSGSLACDRIRAGARSAESISDRGSPRSAPTRCHRPCSAGHSDFRDPVPADFHWSRCPAGGSRAGVRGSPDRHRKAVLRCPHSALCADLPARGRARQESVDRPRKAHIRRTSRSPACAWR